MYIGVTNYPDFLKTQHVLTALAGQTTFSSLNYDPGNVEVYKNGLRLLPSQYSAPNGTDVTLYAACVAGDKIDVVSREENAVGSDVVSVNGKTGVVVLDHYDFPDMPWLDGTGRIPSSLLPTSVVGAVVYQGTWNAASGSAPSASPSKGQYWVVANGGYTDLSGINVWYAGDVAIYNGTDWDRIDGSANEVLSVNGHTGNVVLAAGDITSSLGFTPVQQGGGIGQTANKVYVGWSASGLKATVDSTDIGHVVMADPAGYIYAGGTASILLLSSNQGLINVGTDLPAFGAQYLRLRAQPSLWGGPYGELLIGSNGQNKFTGYTNLVGGAETVTPAFGDSSAKVATTAFVQTALGNFDGLLGKVDRAGDTMTAALTILGNGSGVLTSQSAYASSASAVGWSNSTAITGTFDNNYATQSVAPGASSAIITSDHSTISIPLSANVTGVSVRVKAHASNNTLDVTGILQLKGSSFPSGGLENYFTVPNSSGGITVLGSSSTMLGAPNLTPAMVNDAAFGIKLYFATDFGDGGTPIIDVDGIEVTVHYADIGITGGQLFLGNSTSAKLVFDGSKYVLPNFPTSLGGALTVSGSIAGTSITSNSVPVLTTSAGSITANFTKPLTVYGTGMVGSNATGSKFISTDAPSGGVDGDVWYRYSL